MCRRKDHWPPCCMGVAACGPHACTCGENPPPEKDDFEELRQEIAKLTRRVAKLERKQK